MCAHCTRCFAFSNANSEHADIQQAIISTWIRKANFFSLFLTQCVDALYVVITRKMFVTLARESNANEKYPKKRVMKAMANKSMVSTKINLFYFC